MGDSPELIKTFNALQRVTRRQIHNYPYISLKQYLKLFAMSVLKRKNLMKKDNFFWPNGLLAISLEWSYRKSKSNEDLKTLEKYYNKWLKNGVSLKNADYVINGYSLIYLYKKTKNKKYLKIIKILIEYIKSHPKTEIGSIPYRNSNPNLVFVDNLGMICPFLCRYGKEFNDDYSIDLAIKQLTNFLNFGMDNDSSLPYHGFDSYNKTKLGIIGWGRAIGWLLIGLVDSLEYIPKSHIKYQYLCEEYEKIVSNVITYQLKDGNFTWQIPAIEGHIDTSSTSMICYAVRRGVMLGILPELYLENANLGLDALHKNTIDGVVQNCSAECRGLGMYPQIYSSYPWAQGPTTALTAISIQ